MSRKNRKRPRTAPVGPPKTETTASVRGWRIAFLVLCVVGFLLSADLQRLHVNVHTDPDYQSYCAMSERVNCETVAASDYAVALGLPVSAWGLLFYATLGMFAVWGLRSRLFAPTWPVGLLWGVGMLAALAAVVLFLISHFIVQSVCLVCAGTYLVNIALFVVAWLELKRLRAAPLTALSSDLAAVRRRSRGVLGLVALPVIAALVLWAGLPRYWEVEVGTGPGGLAVGVTADGHPWIGATDASVVIEEYSDYQCPHCERGHGEMRRLLERHPDTLRLVHRNYPLDQACNPTIRQAFHPYACNYALLAWCSGEQRRFWEANDYLFTEGRRRTRVTSRELAERLDLDASDLDSCLSSDAARAALREDLAAGLSHNVRGTPTFVIGERIYPGRIPEDVLTELLGDSPPAETPTPTEE